ncbi:hypothetical protein CS022_03390 [Veronia nyctiphanis]|uniref:Uncharacterized protein n=1 Tax=Veronia nyctiphanis TaxID=1278244 RepID=A0A4Q0YZP0_9GAMM|nr:hypothetical protein [Veronia nyctiphanis]RXJ74621.1 hypothetical protein CS022_03390 [Veronia nyctiphanis]
MKTYKTGERYIEILDKHVLSSMNGIAETSSSHQFSFALFCLENCKPYRIIEISSEVTYRTVNQNLLKIGFDWLKFEPGAHPSNVDSEFHFSPAKEWQLHQLNTLKLSFMETRLKPANSST